MKKPFVTFPRLVPMMIIMGTIFFISHQSGSDLNAPEIKHLDKVAHFIIYAFLAASIIWAPQKEVKMKKPYHVIFITILICFFYGISDEYHQSFIAERSASGADLVADLCGALFICSLWVKNNLKSR